MVSQWEGCMLVLSIFNTWIESMLQNVRLSGTKERISSEERRGINPWDVRLQAMVPPVPRSRMRFIKYKSPYQ